VDCRVSPLLLCLCLLGPWSAAGPRPDESDEDQRKTLEAVRAKAHYFALVASKVIRRETARGSGGSTGGFGQGGGRKWNNAQTYCGFLTPEHRERLYVIAAASVPESETFEHVRVHFFRKPGRAHRAEFVGQDKLSKLLVFRLKKGTRLGRSFRKPHAPLLDPPPLVPGDAVVSLGHPYDAEKKTWVNWQTMVGTLRDPARKPAPKHWPIHELGDLIRHRTDFGRYAHYWHGGPLVRVRKDSAVEILGINFNSMEGVQRALPYARAIEIRDRVIAEAATK